MRRHELTKFDAICTRVVDGDTIDVWPFPGQPGNGQIVRVRIDGIDAPEIFPTKTAEGLAAQIFLERAVLDELVTVFPRRAWTDPYGRVIALVIIDTWEGGRKNREHGISIASMMLAARLARPYKVHGRRTQKLPTCPTCGARHVLDGSVLCGPHFLIV